MTLKEKFKKQKIYINTYTFKLTTESAEEFEQIADDYAIEFLIWASQFELQRFDKDKWQVLGLAAFGFTKTVSTKEILEQFKKEKGL